MPADWIEKQFDQLKKLAQDRFGALSEAEISMLRAVITGDFAWCGPSRKDDDPGNDASSEQDWGLQRSIRADLLRWLCIDTIAQSYIDLVGIRLHGAKISGEFNLSCAVLPFPLQLRRCRFSGGIYLFSTVLPYLDLSGSFVKLLMADCMTVKGSFFLKDKFTASGEVRLMGAQIDGSLDCSGGIFRNPPRLDISGSGTALNAATISVKGSVNLRDGFYSEGEVWFAGAHIGANLDCSGSTFHNIAKKDIKKSGAALIAVNITVDGNIFLRSGFNATGLVNLQVAEVGGYLDCDNSVFDNPSPQGEPKTNAALELGSVTIKRNLSLRQTSILEGGLSLISAHIEGDVYTTGGRFSDWLGYGLTVRHIMSWRAIKDPQTTKLDLRNASIGSLADDRASWPARKKLQLDGLTYGRIAFGPKDTASRLQWLALQEDFTPQPYRQLSKVLREDGDDPGALRVLYEMEKRKHREVRHGWPARLWNPFFRGIIGYGIYPCRALWWLLLLIFLGWGVYRCGYSAGIIVPTNKEAYEIFSAGHGPPPNYPHFYASIYSAEHCFPAVSLGMKEAWSPDPNRRGVVTALRIWRWGQILLGWVLATFFVAGITGIARKD